MKAVILFNCFVSGFCAASAMVHFIDGRKKSGWGAVFSAVITAGTVAIMLIWGN